MVCAVRGGSYEGWITWAHMMLVGGLRVIHERLMVRYVVACVHDGVIAGEARVMLAANGAPLSVHARRCEAALEPSPGNAFCVEEVADVFARHGDLIDVLKFGIGRHAIVEERARVTNHGARR